MSYPNVIEIDCGRYGIYFADPIGEEDRWEVIDSLGAFDAVGVVEYDPCHKASGNSPYKGHNYNTGQFFRGMTVDDVTYDIARSEWDDE